MKSWWNQSPVLPGPWSVCWCLCLDHTLVVALKSGAWEAPALSFSFYSIFNYSGVQMMGASVCVVSVQLPWAVDCFRCHWHADCLQSSSPRPWESYYGYLSVCLWLVTSFCSILQFSECSCLFLPWLNVSLLGYFCSLKFVMIFSVCMYVCINVHSCTHRVIRDQLWIVNSLFWGSASGSQTHTQSVYLLKQLTGSVLFFFNL